MEPKVIPITGVIGQDFTGDDLRKLLEGVDEGQPVRFDIASPGGFVMEGLEVSNIIKSMKNETETRLMGLCASMASYVAMAGKKVTAHDNAVFMIHNVSAVSVGDHRDMRKTADTIEALSNLLANGYAAKTGKTIEDVRKMMDDETYLFGPESKEHGFVDEILPSTPNKTIPSTQEDKKQALMDAHAKVAACIEKMKASEKAKSDFMKAAAYLKVNPADTVGSYSASMPIKDEEWDQAAADKRWREHSGATEEPNASYAKAFMWHDGEEADKFGSYKLQVIDFKGGAFVNIRAVRNASARLGQTQGPSAEEKKKIQSIIDRYIERHKKSEEDKNQGVNMNKLKEFLASSAEARAEFEEAITAARDEATAKAEEKFKARAIKVSAFVGPDSVYPKAIKALAVKVLSGESKMSALEGATAVYDAGLEEKKSAAAQREDKNLNPKNIDPALAQIGPIPESGNCTTAEEQDAEIARVRAIRKAGNIASLGAK